MKSILLIICFAICTTVFSQELEGSWILTHQNGVAITDQEYIKIYQDGYFALGGEYNLEGNVYEEHLDFLTLDPEQIGTTNKYTLDFANDRLVISTKIKGEDLIEIWERLSQEEDDLTRNWVITGRKRGDKISEMTPGARRTVKILSGGRFQWIAFNSETKAFSGTGGGEYEAKDGKYIEKITFFSKDDSRVGAQLEFDYEVIDGKWHHSGLSSKGDPIYEIWSPYENAYKKKGN